jgi:electron transfer flavoprotein alpha subunit
MSYVLVVSEVRKNLFEERNLDSIGLSALLEREAVLLVPEGTQNVNEALVDRVLKVKGAEDIFLNPLNLITILQHVFEAHGKPDFLIFTHSASGMEGAAYTAGHFSFPIITDVSGFDKEAGSFSKSYYSDKIFGEFRSVAAGTCILTVRSGSFKDNAREKASAAITETIEAPHAHEGRMFLEYVEEEKGAVDVTKAEFLVSVGRGIGSKDEVPKYEELARAVRGVLSCSRPVVDKLWLPKERQVGTSGKTVKPKVYLAMGISGAFQHIAGMKDADCIIAVNKDPEAPIFQYAHFGIVADVHKLRDKLIETAKGS